MGAWPEDGELFVGLVAPIGVDLDAVTEATINALKSVEYETELVRFTDIMRALGGPYANVAERPEDARYHQLMQQGNALREQVGSPAAMAMLGV